MVKSEKHGSVLGLPLIRDINNQLITECTPEHYEIIKENIENQVKTATMIFGSYKKGISNEEPNVIHFVNDESKLSAVFKNKEIKEFITFWELSLNQYKELIENVNVS